MDHVEIGPDETRVIVAGYDVPPYVDAVAYIRNTLGVYGIRYADGRTDWLGYAGEAFGDDADSIELHPQEAR